MKKSPSLVGQLAEETLHQQQAGHCSISGIRVCTEETVIINNTTTKEHDTQVQVARDSGSKAQLVEKTFLDSRVRARDPLLENYYDVNQVIISNIMCLLPPTLHLNFSSGEWAKDPQVLP